MHAAGYGNGTFAMIDMLRKTERDAGTENFGNRNRIHRSGRSSERPVWRRDLLTGMDGKIIGGRLWRGEFNVDGGARNVRTFGARRSRLRAWKAKIKLIE